MKTIVRVERLGMPMNGEKGSTTNDYFKVSVDRDDGWGQTKVVWARDELDAWRMVTEELKDEAEEDTED